MEPKMLLAKISSFNNSFEIKFVYLGIHFLNIQMIDRAIASKITELLAKYPIISITGPRQSGKTTLAKILKPKYQYVTLENPSDRLFAQQDPVGFLETYQNGVILDEVLCQRCFRIYKLLQMLANVMENTF